MAMSMGGIGEMIKPYKRATDTIKKTGAHYLVALTVTIGIVAGMANANNATTQTANGAGGEGNPGPGAIAVIQEALDIESHLSPNQNMYIYHHTTRDYVWHYLNVYNSYPGGPTFADPNEAQCAEFVYYTYQLAGHTLPLGGNALDYWDDYSNDQNYRIVPGKVGQPKPNYQQWQDQWQEIANGSGLPTPGDIVIWGGGLAEDGYALGGDPKNFNGTDGIGHVAIAVSVTPPTATTQGSLIVAMANGPGTIAVDQANPLDTNATVVPASSLNLSGVTITPGTMLYKMTIDSNMNAQTWSGMYILGYVHNTTKDFQSLPSPTNGQPVVYTGNDPGLPKNLPPDAQSQVYIQDAETDAQNNGISADIFVRQIMQESGFNPKALSPAGAEGIAQYMPATAAARGLDPYDPVASLAQAAKDDKNAINTYNNPTYQKYVSSSSTLEQTAYMLALAAYNEGAGDNNGSGLGATLRYADAANDSTQWYNYLPAETKGYLNSILGLKL